MHARLNRERSHGLDGADPAFDFGFDPAAEGFTSALAGKECAWP